MESIVKAVKSKHPNQIIIVGGAPLSEEFCRKIGANFYASDPQGAVEYLKQFAA
jgi:5-methyltetrahydrofolate--homocysteine methyltransferase